MLSGTAEYALRAVLHLAERGSAEPVRVGEIAEALGAPRNYLSKILHQLVQAGVLQSSRGKHGGFALAKSPERLSLLRVINAFDKIAERRSCLLGRPQCADRVACAVHWRWKDLSEQIATFFRETTVADLLAGTEIPAGTLAGGGTDA